MLQSLPEKQLRQSLKAYRPLKPRVKFNLSLSNKAANFRRNLNTTRPPESEVRRTTITKTETKTINFNILEVDFLTNQLPISSLGWQAAKMTLEIGWLPVCKSCHAPQAWSHKSNKIKLHVIALYGYIWFWLRDYSDIDLTYFYILLWRYSLPLFVYFIADMTV